MRDSPVVDVGELSINDSKGNNRLSSDLNLEYI